MEASATTLNIQGPEPPPAVPPKHTHGPNFGRYVEGCVACSRKYPNGPGSKPKTRIRRDIPAEKIAALQAEVERLKAAPAPQPAPAPSQEQAETIIALMDQIDRLKAEAAASVSQVPAAKASSASSSTDALVDLMLRRESRTIEKEEELLRRAAEAREQMLMIEREHIAQIDRIQSACLHVKENGRSAICD